MIDNECLRSGEYSSFFKFRGKELYENIERELLFYYFACGRLPMPQPR